jgi:hypothetical protein
MPLPIVKPKILDFNQGDFEPLGRGSAGHLVSSQELAERSGHLVISSNLLHLHIAIYACKYFIISLFAFIVFYKLFRVIL